MSLSVIHLTPSPVSWNLLMDQTLRQCPRVSFSVTSPESGAGGGGRQLLCAEMAEARKLARHGGLLKLDGRVRVSKKADARKVETLWV